MADDLIIPTSATKAEKYQALIPQIEGLLLGEKNQVANMANICAALKEGMGFFWVGFYLVDSLEELVLGPFQGPVACTRIRKGKGVCGTSWEKKEMIIVPDVDKFPGHIACSSASRSEIVIPVFNGDHVFAILDVDSDLPDAFDNEDAQFLSQIVNFLA